MTINLNDLTFLTSAAGENLLNRLAGEDLGEAHTLRLLDKLRKDYPAEQARAVLEMARLRLKAVAKFGDDARRMVFTRDALEQASDPLIRAYRGREIAAEKISLVDACCGIGADTLAFARAGAEVVGLDLDPLRVAMARHNAEALDLKARFEAADVRDNLPQADVVFFDPARRDDNGKRIYDVERYLPPLSTIRGWRHGTIMVKLSPGVDLEQLAPYPGAVQFISVDGDLKEAVLHTGNDYAGYGLFATLLTAEGEYHWHNADINRQPLQNEVKIENPRAWLVEPDAALLRAGLVQDAAFTMDGSLLDATIAYFTTDARPDSAWVRAWRVLDWMPFNVKKLRAYLRERNVGRVTIKKRGSAVTPEVLMPQLKLKGDATRTLVLTRLREQPVVLVCEDSF